MMKTQDRDQNNQYELTIGDGETHFILLDKKEPGALMDVKGFRLENENINTARHPIGGNENLPFKLELVETGENYGGGAGSKAIVLTGGYLKSTGTEQNPAYTYEQKDYIEYNPLTNPVFLCIVT
jgi:hypothetical protein